MPATAPSDQAPGVERPKYPLHAMTTFELRDYRRELERTIYAHLDAELAKSIAEEGRTPVV